MIKKNEDVLFVGNFCFPTGNAASNINISMGKIFSELGYNVYFIGTDNLNNNSILDCDIKYKGFIGTNFNKPSFLRELKIYKKKYNTIIEYITKNIKNLKYIILYNSPSITLFNQMLFKWCKKNDINILVYVADWLAPTYGNYLFRFLKFIDTEFRMRLLNKKADGIIAISNFLANYYNKNNVIVIPPLFDKKEVGEFLNKKENFIKLIYVGVPFPTDGRKVKENSYKDRLDIVIDYLLNVKAKYEFNIYGLSEEEYLRVIPRHSKKINKKIIFHGRQSRDNILKELRKSDFLIFFRDNTKVTQAGFSSKFAESINCGIPVVPTNTSDLSNYLIDGFNGFFIDMDELGLKKMENILNLDRNKIEKLKENAYNCNFFDYKNYINQVEYFLDKLGK